MQAKIFVLILVLVCPNVMGKSKKLSRLQSDPLSKTRCDLMCYDVSKETRSKCRSQCRQQQQKPGTCPLSDSPQWAAACVEACNTDAQCDGVQRCCHHGCGATCRDPVDLLNLPGLPALPALEEPKEKKRSVLVRWSDGVGDLARAVPGKTLYILEEQHHLGPKYEEARLGAWSLILRTNKTKVSLRNLLKPGRWYRFRVAAVSSAGSRGFSKPSSPFTPRKGPRPPAPPKKLRVRPIQTNNGTVTVRFEWREPRSDLPVLRYKVFWSRRVRGLGGELDSVLVNHQTVPKDQNYVNIKDLEPNSMYFLQVQTISQFGLGKLRSEKAAIFFNTTGNNADAPQPLQRRERRITGLKLEKILWANNKIGAKISWDPLRNKDRQQKRYYVNWRTLKCDNKPKENHSAVTEKTSIDIFELDYECQYAVNVNRSLKSKTPDSELIVNVPRCDYFKARINNTSVVQCDT